MGRFSAARPVLCTARPGPFTAAKEARPGPCRYLVVDRPGQYITFNIQCKKAAILMLHCFSQAPVTKQVVQYMWDKTKILCSTKLE